MKGYLQRIASQAPKPSGNITQLHPLVGSISTAPKHEIPSEGIHEETITTSGGQPDSVQGLLQGKIETPQRISAWEHRKATALTQPKEPLQEHSVAQAPVEATPFQPLLGKVETDTSPARPRDAAPTLHPVQEPSRERGEQGERSQTDTPKRTFLRNDAKSKREEKTTHESSPPPQSPLETPIIEPPQRSAPVPHFTATRGTPQSRLAGAARPSPPGADEIQINIGRIELTAVPQTPQRPAAPARKSINLDEYLKRRNGRNG
jgi:hypothetical protein